MVFAINQPRRPVAVEFKKSIDAVWPLLVGAFVLQTAIPLLFRDQFYLALLSDDLADIFASFAILFALPYSKINLKLMALFYAMWCVFAFLNNIAIEVAIEHIRIWQFMVGVFCIGVMGFISGWLLELHKFGNNTDA